MVPTALISWACGLVHSVDVVWSHSVGLVTWSRYGVWRWGLMSVSPCFAGLVQLLAFLLVLIISFVFIRSYVSISMKSSRLPRWLGECSSLLGHGLWAMAEGQGSSLPSTPGDPRDMA